MNFYKLLKAKQLRKKISRDLVRRVFGPGRKEDSTYEDKEVDVTTVTNADGSKTKTTQTHTDKDAARENHWGYTRILGKLKKLGIKSLSKNTVKRILKDAGYDQGPKRGEGTWDEFLKQHAASLWQCDFFSKRILTLKGIRDVFVIAFLNVKSRKVILSPVTLKPTEEWVIAQAESFVHQARFESIPVATVQHDNDSKFGKAFQAKLKSLRVQSRRTAIRSPNTNAYVERFIQSIGQECLDRFIVFGEKHMDHLCAEYLAHYHAERPHQGLDNELLNAPKQRGRPRTTRGKIEDEIVTLREVRCHSRLGGLLKSYSRRAA